MLKTQTKATPIQTKKRSLSHSAVHLHVRLLVGLNTLILDLTFEPPIICVTTFVIKHHRTQNSIGICRLKCKTYNCLHIGQTGRCLGIRHWEHIRYIKTNNLNSAYVLHILNNRHEYGSTEETMELLKTCNKGAKMSCWESLCIHI